MAGEDPQWRAPLRCEEAHAPIVARGQEVGVVGRESQMQDRVAVRAEVDEALRVARGPEACDAVLTAREDKSAVARDGARVDGPGVPDERVHARRLRCRPSLGEEARIEDAISREAAERDGPVGAATCGEPEGG